MYTFCVTGCKTRQAQVQLCKHRLHAHGQFCTCLIVTATQNLLWHCNAHCNTPVMALQHICYGTATRCTEKHSWQTDATVPLQPTMQGTYYSNARAGFTKSRPCSCSCRASTATSDLAEEFLFQLVSPALVSGYISCQVSNVSTLEHHLHKNTMQE